MGFGNGSDLDAFCKLIPSSVNSVGGFGQEPLHETDTPIDQDADMFISLHCNAFANRAIHGLETFFWSGNHQGRRLASMVNIQLAIDTGWRDRGVKNTNVFGVLRRLPAFPACLIEYNFISNPEFEQRFRDPKVLNLLARSTATGIRNYSRLYF